jgi:hypothetical protein
MTATRTYLTGGVGSHHTDEAFGDPYELPNERAYCETCAAIASVMLCWRLLLITGEARYADLMERTLYNAFLPGISIDGLGYLYVNPLQVREDSPGAADDPNYHYASPEQVRAGYAGGAGDQSAGRKPWFRCACCPPNIMRLFASLQHYLAAATAEGLWLCHYATGEVTADLSGQPAVVRVSTGYPWHGEVAVEVTAAGGAPWTLHLRVPAWCDKPVLTVNGERADAQQEDGWLRVTRPWQAGDTAVLELPMAPRLTAGHPRADAVRGCLAVERGPLVYCLEQGDLPAGVRMDDVAVDPGAQLRASEQPDLLGGVTTVTIPGFLRQDDGGDGWWPYQSPDPGGQRWQPLELTAVPYLAWANRGPGAMRVWLPRYPER